MTFEKVISPVLDDKFNSHPNDSEIWKKERYKPEEMTDAIRSRHPNWYCYTIQFDGLRIVQMTKSIQEL